MGENLMKLQIDFYEKDEFAIQIEGKWKLFDEKESELFIFTSFVLRQMYNVGKHLIIDALAGALIDDPQKLLGSSPSFSDGFTLIARRQEFMYRASGMEDNLVRLAMSDLYPKISGNPFVEVLDEYILHSPQIVNYRGDAKKQYIYYPEKHKLEWKGFGVIGTLLGKDAGFYALNSSLALYRYLGNNHINEEKYINSLTLLAERCAILQMAGKTENVLSIHPDTAEHILKEVLSAEGN
jgi:hypothetical protein